MKKNRQPTQHHKKDGQEKRLRVSDDLLWGIHPVLELLTLEPAKLTEIYLVKEKKGGKFEEIIEKGRKNKIKLRFVSSIKITGENASQIRHQGVVAKIVQTALWSLNDILHLFEEKVQNGEQPLLIACDSLQDPHNIGAIVRSAHAAGAAGILLTRERSAPLGGTAAKSAAGAMAHMPIAQVTNLVQALKEVKKCGAWVYGTVKDAESQSIYEMDLTGPSCVVIGSEGQGIRPLVKKECDQTVNIPMAGKLDSLNASVAAGVIMFEILRQKILKKHEKPD